MSQFKDELPESDKEQFQPLLVKSSGFSFNSAGFLVCSQFCSESHGNGSNCVPFLMVAVVRGPAKVLQMTEDLPMAVYALFSSQTEEALHTLKDLRAVSDS